MNLPFKHLPKLFVLLFAFLVVSCEQEDETSFKTISEISTSNYPYSVQIISQEDYKTNLQVLDAIKDVFNKKENSSNKSIYNSDYDFTIETEYVKYVESVDGTYHSYTFPISRTNQEEGKLENLVLSSLEDGSYQAVLMSYTLTSEQLIELVNNDHISTSYPIEMVILEDDFSDLAQRTLVQVCDIVAPQVFHTTPDTGETFLYNEGDTCYHNTEGNQCTITVINYPPNCYFIDVEPGSDELIYGDSGATIVGGSGSSSTNKPIVTSPAIHLEKPTVLFAKFSGLYLNDEQHAWINHIDNIDIKNSVQSFLANNQNAEGDVTVETYNLASKAIDILRGSQTVSSLNSIFEARSFTEITGNVLTNKNSLIFTEHAEAWSEIDPDNVLSFTDWILIGQKAFEIYQILPSYTISTLLDPTDLSLTHQQLLSRNSLFISFLPNLKSIIGDTWPQSDAEWEAVGTIMGQFLVEIGLAVIPGSGMVDAINEAEAGNYGAVAFALATVVADFFGGIIIKSVAKIGKVAYKTFKIFKLVYKYLDDVIGSINLGFKTLLDNNIVKILDNFDNEIARVVDNILTFKYSGFGGDIVTNPNKTTTVVGKWIDNINGGGTKDIIESGLSKSGENLGGLNALNFDGSGMTEAQQWVINQQWLNDVIARSDIIRVISNPLNRNHIFNNTTNIPESVFSTSQSLSNFLQNLTSSQIEQLSFFGREVRHLFQNGYIFNSTINQFFL